MQLHRETASDDTVYISGYTGGTILSEVMIENGIIGAVGACLSQIERTENKVGYAF